MKELSVNKLENLEGGKFWGDDCGEWGHLGGGCFIRTCKVKRFWFTWDVKPDMFGCNN